MNPEDPSIPEQNLPMPEEAVVEPRVLDVVVEPELTPEATDKPTNTLPTTLTAAEDAAAFVAKIFAET